MGSETNLGSVLAKAGAAGIGGYQAGKQQQQKDQLTNLMTALQMQQHQSAQEQHKLNMQFALMRNEKAGLELRKAQDFALMTPDEQLQKKADEAISLYNAQFDAYENQIGDFIRSDTVQNAPSGTSFGIPGGGSYKTAIPPTTKTPQPTFAQDFILQHPKGGSDALLTNLLGGKGTPKSIRDKREIALSKDESLNMAYYKQFGVWSEPEDFWEEPEFLGYRDDVTQEEIDAFWSMRERLLGGDEQGGGQFDIDALIQQLEGELGTE